MGAEVSRAALSAEEVQHCRQKAQDEVLQALEGRTTKRVFARADTPVQVFDAPSCSPSVGTKALQQRKYVEASAQTEATNQYTDHAADGQVTTKRKATDTNLQEREPKAARISSKLPVADHGPSNLVLSCPERAWYAHREVILPASTPLLMAYMQSKDQRTIVLKDCKPAAVHSMLSFLYSGDYNADQYCQTGNSYPLELHVMVYSLAITYEIGPLAYSAYVKFSSLLAQQPDPPGLCVVMLEILQNNPYRKEPLQKALLDSLEKPRSVRGAFAPHRLVTRAREFKRLLDRSEASKASSSDPSSAPLTVPDRSKNTGFSPAAPGAMSIRTASSITPQGPAALVKVRPRGTIEYHCRLCDHVFQMGWVKELAGLFACPKCGEKRPGLHWDSSRKPWNYGA